MPDTWTANQEHLRSVLLAYGAECGVESRVLKPRDPEWTCHVNTPVWHGDVYIHPVGDLFIHPLFLSALVLAAGVGILAGLGWGRFFWRKGGSD